MTARVRYTAEFDYPGMLFPESITREVSAATLEAVLAAAPTDEDGFFKRDGWYAVTVHAIRERRFVADDSDEETWVRQTAQRVCRWVVGEAIHVDDIEDTDRNAILRSNIRVNTTDGYGVLTRAGNWQLASDYDAVLAPSEVTS